MNKKIEKLLNRKANRKYLEDFYTSEFCVKRGIYADLKLKEFNQISITKCNENFNKTVNRNVELLKDFIKEYYSKSKLSHRKVGKNDKHSFGVMLYKALYDDPDKYDIRTIGKYDTICKSDALFSLNRIIYFQKYELNLNVANEYKLLRKKNILYFPPESHINPDRYKNFNDKIDYLLFDIKNYLEGNKKICKMKCTYKLKATQKWFESLDYDFSNLVLWLRLDGKFVKKINGKYEVINIENGKIISKYPKNYNWSKTYYDNLKKIVRKYK